jgi:hypothetical protein
MKRRKQMLASVEQLVKILAVGEGLRAVSLIGSDERSDLMWEDYCQGDPSQSPRLLLIADRLTALANAYGSVATVLVENPASVVSVLQFQGSPQGWRQAPASEVRWKFTAAGYNGGYRFPDLKDVEMCPAVGA